MCPGSVGWREDRQQQTCCCWTAVAVSLDLGMATLSNGSSPVLKSLTPLTQDLTFTLMTSVCRWYANCPSRSGHCIEHSRPGIQYSVHKSLYSIYYIHRQQTTRSEGSRHVSRVTVTGPSYFPILPSSCLSLVGGSVQLVRSSPALQVWASTVPLLAGCGATTGLHPTISPRTEYNDWQLS